MGYFGSAMWEDEMDNEIERVDPWRVRRRLRGSYCCRCGELGKPHDAILRAPLSPSPERSNDG